MLLAHAEESCGELREGRAQYQFHAGLAILLHGEWVGDIQAGLAILQKQESLVWAFRRATFLGSQGDAQGIGTGEGERTGEGLGRGDSIGVTG